MMIEPRVNEIKEFLEIASDFENPLELVRESLSNAYDANAEEVEISIHPTDNGSNIRIQDDGNGMDEEELKSFFDLGNSSKEDSIGYKGHGTKIYYKSDKIEVVTVKDGICRRAIMDEPWKKLNRKELPEYSVEEVSPPMRQDGTSIEITNFRSGRGFDKESLTYNKIHHYLKWKTIAGSTEHHFNPAAHQMQIRVRLDSEIDDTKDALVTDNRLEFPDEQIEPDSSEWPTERMCKHYPRNEIDIEYDDGKTTVEIVGMIGGKEARNELPTYGKHSAQFGIWLAKDHIKIEQVNDVVPNGIQPTHLFFIANCQDLELSANRGKIRNKSSTLYRNILEEIEHYLSKICRDPWFKNYLRTRHRAERERKIQSRIKSISQRRETLLKKENIEPTNESELAVALERSNRANGNAEITIADFQPNAEHVQCFIRQNESLKTAATEMTVEDFLRNDREFASVEALLVWDWGDKDYLREQARTNHLNGNIEIDFDDSQIKVSETDIQQSVEVITVSNRLGAKVNEDTLELG